MPSRVIVLTVCAVQYEGESVGREIALDVGLAGEFLTSNLRLAPGQTRELAHEVAQFRTDGDEFSAVGQIQVTERDAVYSDTGSSNVSWNLDLRQPGLLESVQRVEVVEAGGQREGTAGVFLVTLRARVVAATRFVHESDTGWLTGMALTLAFSPTGMRVSS